VYFNSHRPASWGAAIIKWEMHVILQRYFHLIFPCISLCLLPGRWIKICIVKYIDILFNRNAAHSGIQFRKLFGVLSLPTFGYLVFQLTNNSILQLKINFCQWAETLFHLLCYRCVRWIKVSITSLLQQC